MPNLTKLQRAEREWGRTASQLVYAQGEIVQLKRVLDEQTKLLETARNEIDELNQKLEAADDKAQGYVQKYNNVQAQLNGSMTIIQALLLLIATNKK